MQIIEELTTHNKTSPLTPLHTNSYPSNFALKTHSFEAASLSRNHVSSPSAETSAAGSGGEAEVGPVANTIFVVSASSGPVTTIAISEAEFMTGNVKVIRGGGGLGESRMKVTQRSFS